MAKEEELQYRIGIESIPAFSSGGWRGEGAMAMGIVIPTWREVGVC